MSVRLIRIAITTIALSFVACRRTVIGGFVDSPDKKYRVYERVLGAYGQSFASPSEKIIVTTIVMIGPSEMILFNRKQTLKGCDVGWTANWLDSSNVAVEFYDFGPNVTDYEARNKGMGSNHLHTLVYHIDAKSVKVTEQ